jgi:L-fuconate dehydratase
MVQHLSMFDYVAVSGTQRDRVIEYVDHLHEHFVDPVRLSGGRYLAPTEPGLGARLKEETLAEYRFPDGPVWRDELPAAAPDKGVGEQ